MNGGWIIALGYLGEEMDYMHRCEAEVGVCGQAMS